MTDHDIQFLDDLREQLRRAAVQHERRPRKVQALRTPIVVAALALTLAGAAAATVTGVLHPLDKMFGSSDRAIVGTGKTAAGSHWWLVSSREGRNQCLSLRVDRPLRIDRSASREGPMASGQCGGITAGSFEATIGPADAAGVGLAFGTAPDRAATVSVTGPDGMRTAPVFDDEHGIAGRFFVVEIPSQNYFSDITVRLSDRAGTPIAAESLHSLVKAASPLGSR